MAGVSSSSSSSPDASAATSPPPAAPMSKRRSGKNIFVRERSPRKLNFLDVDPKTLARQFCLFDQKMVARVRFQELVAGRWNKGKGENVIALRDRSNLITQWVATEILQTPNTKQRIVVLSNFLELCMNLLEMRNFKTSFNVYSGLRMPQVARLNKTWNGLDPKTMTLWQDLESELRGLATFFEQSLAAPSPKILPVSLLLRFLEVKEQEPDTHRRYVHMINFNKMRAVADLVKPFIDSQSVQYGFEENAMIQVYLEKYLTVIDSQHKLTKMSRDIEGDSGNPSNVVVSPRAQKHVQLNTGSSSSSKPAKVSEGSKAADAAAKKVGHPSDSAEKSLIQNDPMNGKTTAQIHQEIHNELVGKWKRPLAKCSVGSDLPRLIAKILVIDARGHTLYKCREDRKKIYLAREMNMFLRCMAQQLESTKDAKAIEKSFRDYFTVEARSEASTDIIKETGLFVSEVLGESSVVTSLLKITASQGIISPAWVRLKLFILAKFPFKDARKGWRVYIIFEPFFVTICHIKKEMSSEEMAGSRPFEFTWELKMVFDRKLEQMIECSLVISELSISDDMPSDRQLSLTEVLKPWRGPSFRSSIQYGLEGESEESSFMPEEAVATAAQKKAFAAEKAAAALSPSSQKKTQSEKKIVVENVFTGTARRAKSDAKIQTKKALITTPDDSDNLDPGFGGQSPERASPARLKRKKSSKDKLEAKSDKEDGYHSGGSHRRSGSGSKEKSLAKSKSRETLQDANDPSTASRRTSSGDKNKILLTGDKGSPSTGSPVSHPSTSKRSGSLTKDETTKIVHHSSVAFGPAATAPQPSVAPPIMSPVSPRRAPQNAISKASELLHDESESIDDVAINHLRRLAPVSRGRSTSVGKTGQPISSAAAGSRAPVSSAAPAALAATPPPTGSPAPIGTSLSSPNLTGKRLVFNDSATVNDGATAPLRKEPATSPASAKSAPGSSGAIAGSGSDESSSASNTGSGDHRKRMGSSHDRLNTSVRKSLELKNLDVVRAFTEEAEVVDSDGNVVSGRKKSARKSMPAQRSKTPRGSSKSDRSAVTSSGILSDPEGSPPSASRLSVAAASVHLGSSSARPSTSKSSMHHQSTGSTSARSSASGKHLKDKEKDREKDKERQSSRTSQGSSSGHRSTAITPREPLESARDRLDREAERERERQREKERDSHERRGEDAPRSSSRDANGSPRLGSPRLDGTPRGSPRDKSAQSSPGAGDADAPASMSSSGHLRRSRASSRSSRDIRVFESSNPSTPTQSTPTTPTATETASEAGQDPSSARRRPRAPSLGIDERAPYNVQQSKSVARDGNASLATVEENSPRRDSVESAGRANALPVPPPPVPLGMISSRYSAPDISTATGSAATKTSMPVTTNRIPQRPSAIALAAVAAQGGPALAEWDVTESDVSDADSSVEDPFQ
jgi:hypothetical protein